MAAFAVAAATAAAAANAGAAPPLRVCVIGGSIGGLAAATAFARLGASVRVFERASTGFAGRGSSLGFVDVNLWQRLTGRRMMRRGQPAGRHQGAYLYGDLWEFLAAGLPASAFRYGSAVADIGDPERPSVLGEAFDLCVVADGGWSELRGKYFTSAVPEYAGWQAWRFRVERDKVPGFEAEGEYVAAPPYAHVASIFLEVAANDGTDYIMGGIAIASPEADVVKPGAGANRHASADSAAQVAAAAAKAAGAPAVASVSASSGAASAPAPAVAVAAAPAAAADAAPASAAALASAAKEAEETPEWLLPFFRKLYAGAAGGDLVRVAEACIANGKITPMPQFEFASPVVVRGRAVLTGDAAHMGVPRTAVGAHTAVLDGMGLLEAFHPLLMPAGGRSAVEGVIADAAAASPGGGGGGGGNGWASVVDRGLAAYAPGGLQRARGLYERSLEVSRPVLPAGWSPGAARTPLTRKRAGAMGVRELKAELMVRRVPLAGLAERADLLAALVEAARI